MKTNLTRVLVLFPLILSLLIVSVTADQSGLSSFCGIASRQGSLVWGQGSYTYAGMFPYNQPYLYAAVFKGSCVRIKGECLLGEDGALNPEFLPQIPDPGWEQVRELKEIEG